MIGEVRSLGRMFGESEGETDGAEAAMANGGNSSALKKQPYPRCSTRAMCHRASQSHLQQHSNRCGCPPSGPWESILSLSMAYAGSMAHAKPLSVPAGGLHTRHPGRCSKATKV